MRIENLIVFLKENFEKGIQIPIMKGIKFAQYVERNLKFIKEIALQLVVINVASN